MSRTRVPLGTLLLAAVALPLPAAAGTPFTIIRDRISHGPANCQPALPVFDGNIRKRPLAIGNEGSGNAFITCGFDDISNGASGYSAVGVYLINQAGQAGVTVTCTLVNGLAIDPGAVGYFTKTSSAIAAGATSQIDWSNTDNGDSNFAAPSLSCNLPAGVSIWAVQGLYPEDVGM